MKINCAPELVNDHPDWHHIAEAIAPPATDTEDRPCMRCKRPYKPLTLPNGTCALVCTGCDAGERPEGPTERDLVLYEEVG